MMSGSRRGISGAATARFHALSFQNGKRITVVRVGTFASGYLAPREVTPLGKISVPHDIGMNQRKVKSNWAGKRERLDINALAAAYIDFSRNRFGHGEGFGEAGG